MIEPTQNQNPESKKGCIFFSVWHVVLHVLDWQGDWTGVLSRRDSDPDWRQTTMKQPLFLVLFTTTAAFFYFGWPRAKPTPSAGSVLHSNNQSTATHRSDSRDKPSSAVEPCAMLAVPQAGEARALSSTQSSLDKDIQLCQRDLVAARHPFDELRATPALTLEKLGWLYVEKARTTFDPGFYTLAEQCAACLDGRQPGSSAAMLLRGHVWQSLHRFRQAEPLARALVAQRGLPVDLGLLGDVLMEQGKLTEAIEAYQSMVDLRPDPPAYARISYVRWLRGDLAGALELARMAAQAAGDVKSEAAAWIQTRRSAYEWQAGHTEFAKQCGQSVLQSWPDYAPAHLLLGRISLAEERRDSAVESLQRAALLNPLPEYLWALMEALEVAGKCAEARKIETKLTQAGPVTDPRTYALYLATQKRESAQALALAQRELNERADVHTHDAMAWALAAAGQWAQAHAESVQALAEGTADPRLYLHAGLIARRLGKSDEAQARLAQAWSMRALLLPAEQRLLNEGLTTIQTAAVDNQ
jgi:tetratricopeptide (TPR) repeat protein